MLYPKNTLVTFIAHIYDEYGLFFMHEKMKGTDITERLNINKTILFVNKSNHWKHR